MQQKGIMRLSLPRLLFLAALLVCLALGSEVQTEKPQRKSLWGRITSPVRGLYRRGKKAFASARKTFVRTKGVSSVQDEAQDSEVGEVVEVDVEEVDELIQNEQFLTKDAAHVANEIAENTATSAEGTVEAYTEQIVKEVASASMSTQLTGDDGTEGASELADASVEGLRAERDQRIEARKTVNAAVEIEADKAATEL